MSNNNIHIHVDISQCFSFVVGFGKNYPKYPHHSSSSCPDAPTPCDWDNFESPEPNFHVLEGALVGGPDRTDDQV
jgi:endoglucanase